MNVWMKRALQTGLFTGGLLAVGTGIASADESTVDVTAPVTITDNAVAALGTAPGDTPAEVTLPALSGTVAADLGGVTASVPITAGGNAADVAGVDVAQPAAAPAAAPAGNGSAADADVPVTVCGDGVAVLGDATGSCTAPAGNGGTGNSASGTDGTTPAMGAGAALTACGTGVGVLGTAGGTCAAPGNSGGPADPSSPVAGQPGAFPGTLPGVVAPPQSAVPAAADGGTGNAGSPNAGSPNGGTTNGGTANDRTGTAARTDGELAYTGTTVVLPLLAGLLTLALGLGLGLTGASRRRQGQVG
jgi:hypothetical protein